MLGYVMTVGLRPFQPFMPVYDDWKGREARQK